MTATRVAVTGMGVVAPAGTTVDDFWAGLLEGRSFARSLPSHEDLRLIGCPVADGAWLEGIAVPDRRRWDRVTHLAIAAAEEAIRDAKLDGAGVPPERIGLCVGIGFGAVSTIVSQHEVYASAGWRRMSPFAVPAGMPATVAALLSARADIRGRVSTVSSACASGTQAIADALMWLRAGVVDVVIAGGAEAPLHPFALAAFTRMDAMSRRLDDPTAASRPFDVDRDGFVMGEGSAFVVLRRWDDAVTDANDIYAELLGACVTADAHHITAPDATAEGARACLAGGLGDAGVVPGDVSHVNAHGTATQLNDAAEAKAIAAVFGASSPPVTSLKGAIGHAMGGAGAIELVGAALSMRHGVAPPTVNCDQPDPSLGLDVVHGEPRMIDRGAIVSSSFGFGGQNACLVLGPGVENAR